jgi:lysozyme family protein
MADFEKAFQKLMREEGIGLSDHKADKGGQTFVGIARKFHPQWEGWRHIDAGGTPSTQSVRDFYHINYWMPCRGGDIKSQAAAEALFSQFVNMGANAIKIMQTCLGVVADGKIGPKTITALNAADEEKLLMTYALANIKRYHAIGMRDKTQRVFWPGWFRRALSLVEVSK